MSTHSLSFWETFVVEKEDWSIVVVVVVVVDVRRIEMALSITLEGGIKCKWNEMKMLMNVNVIVKNNVNTVKWNRMKCKWMESEKYSNMSFFHTCTVVGTPVGRGGGPLGIGQIILRGSLFLVLYCFLFRNFKISSSHPPAIASYIWFHRD